MAFVHQSLTDRIYEYLKQGIVTNNFKPGERLEEQEIADNLNVSRTPVREALGRLGADGLVTILPRRGALVVDLSAKDIADVYAVREVLEVLAIQLALPRLTDADVANLNRIHEQFAAGLKRGEYRLCFSRDRELHDELMRLSDNNKLRELYDRLGASIQVTRWMHCDNRDLQERSYREHAAILDVLANRNLDLACQAMRDHIKKVGVDLTASQAA